MNFNDLHIYQTIYETRSLNKAALKLGYTQSNITARLKALEQELNTPLFVRSNLGVKPTKNGQKMHDFATKVLQNYQNLKEDLSINKTKVLISELLFGYIITKKAPFSFEHYDIIIKNTNEIQELITKHAYDMVWTFTPITLPKYSLIKKSHLEACFLKGNKKTAGKVPVAINADINCPFRNLTLKLTQNKNSVTEIDSLEMILELVKKGQATALLPKYLMNDDLVAADSQSWNIPYYFYRYQL